jgi:hypothetical protein
MEVVVEKCLCEYLQNCHLSDQVVEGCPHVPFLEGKVLAMLRHLVLLLANQMEANDPVEILQILAGTVVVYSLIGDSSTLPVVVTPQVLILVIALFQ